MAKGKSEIPPAFMPQPKHCGRGLSPVFGEDRVKCVDMVICEYYCTERCQEYLDYRAERDRKRKEAEREKARTKKTRMDLDI